MKLINSLISSKTLLLLALLCISGISMAQGSHPGAERGLPTPVDGGVLMSILGGAGLISMYLKKGKKDKNKN